MNIDNNEDLLSVVRNAPIGICILDASTLICEMVNAAFLEVAGKPYEAIYGKYYWDSFAEAAPLYEAALANVVREGKKYRASEVELMLVRNGKEEWVFVTFVYEPVKDKEGIVKKVAIWVLENTQQVKSRKVIEELNEELNNVNEELAAANEQQTAINKELLNAHRDLSASNLQLKESEALLRNLFDQAPLAFYILQGEQLIIKLANNRMLKLWNQTKDVIGKPHHEVRSAPQLQPFLKKLDEVYATGVPYIAHEVKTFTAAGNEKEWAYLNFTYQPVKDEEGNTKGVLAIAEDVTEMVLGRMERERIDKKLRQAIDAARLGSWHIQPRTKALEYNDILAAIFGHEGKEKMTYEQAIGQVTEDYRDKIEEEIEQAIANGGDYDITYSQRRFNDNEIIWLRSLGKITRDTDSASTFFSGVVMDITEQVRARQTLQESENRFRSLAENSGMLIAMSDESANGIYFNSEWTTLTGTPTEDLLKYGWADTLHPDDKDRFIEHYLSAFNQQQPFEDEIRIRDKKGEYRWFYLNAPTLSNANGHFSGYISTCIDITDRKTAEQLLAQNAATLKTLNKQLEAARLQSELERERLSSFFMQAPAAICVLGGPQLVYELVNPGYQKMLSGRNLVDRPLFEALPELLGTPLEEVLLNVYRNGEAFIIAELLVPIAEEEGGALQDRYFTFNYIPRKNEDEQTDGILVFVFEVTDQVKARKAVQELNEELAAVNEEQMAANEELQQAQNDYLAVYNQLVKNQEDLLFTIDAAGLATFDLNPANGRFTGNDLLKSWFGLAPEDEIELQKATDVIAEADRNRVVQAIEKALQFSDGGKYDVDYTIINPNNGVSRIVRAKGKTLFNDKQEPIRLSGTLQDITEQKKDEQRKNDFIGMVSHEMKTPLTSLSGYLQLLQTNLDNEDGFTINMLGKASKQVNKMTTLINGFLNVSRLESGKIQIDKRRFNMAELIKEAEEEALSTINSHRIVFAPVETTYINADRDKINQVISNLISNAVKYSSASTTIHVACVTTDGRALVAVKDEGIGIKEEDKDKLFDRYYRVNNDNATTASGFGIGLYLCAEIIHRHDGKIWVDSEVGKGSAFYFSLPIVD